MKEVSRCRRQFLLAETRCHVDGWRDFHLSEGYWIAAHPDLPVHRVEKHRSSVTLLGYIIDPTHTDMGDEDILAAILGTVNSLEDVPACVEPMSGRFAMIVTIGTASALFHDAAGLRQVQYCRDADGDIWCASQAQLIAERLGLAISRDVIEFHDAPIFASGAAEFWLMNNRTPFREISHLLPNHFLDLRTGQAIRFWPTPDCIHPMPLEKAIGLAAPLLQHSIDAASRRHSLKMGVTAGIDSRKTLAASRHSADRICYYTRGHEIDNRNFQDAIIPARLLPRLGLPHQVLPWTPMDAEFLAAYEASVTFARRSKGNIAFTLSRHFEGDFTVMSSNISEITQCNYWLPRSSITGEGLAIATGLYHTFAIQEFDKWLAGARDACREAGMSVLALFHWEQRAGRWAAASFAEYDIVHESFTPYNNRLLNRVLLGIPERHRRDRMRTVALALIQVMWPEVLDEPINPPTTPAMRIQEFVRRSILHKYVTPWFPAYEYLKYIRKKIRAQSANSHRMGKRT